MTEMENPGCALAGATGAGKPCHATAAGAPTLAQPKTRAKRAGFYHVMPDGGEPFTLYAVGREAWALDRLRMAGLQGCTPIEQPAPRWSAYVHSLRGRGVPIETLTEPHGGEFAGHHGRYVLRAIVRKGGAA
ncbi:MAG: hypothetical protein Q8K20_12145 [Gemmobacter sp.]|nr:hypothetical protein [Gemmobacter sp.]